MSETKAETTTENPSPYAKGLRSTASKIALATGGAVVFLATIATVRIVRKLDRRLGNDLGDVVLSVAYHAQAAALAKLAMMRGPGWPVGDPVEDDPDVDAVH